MQIFIRKFYLLLMILCVGLLFSCGKGDKNEPQSAPVKSSSKDILGFSFARLSPVVTGIINGATITLNVAASTDVTALSTNIQLSDKASVSPASGTTNNFSKDATYKVTAEDGSTKTYIVKVIKGKSNEKTISSFSFGGLTPAVNATINEQSKTITATVPSGTVVTALKPTIAVSAKAAVTPASGATQNFSSEVTYTVTAEDGTKQPYKIVVTIAPQVPVIIECGTIPDVLEDKGSGIDYLVKCNLQLTNGKKLTVKPGVTIQFEGEGSGITVTKDAALYMVGTAAKPIVLEGKTTRAGSWMGIQMDSKSLDNKWEYVTIQHAGSGTYPAALLIADEAYFLHRSQIWIKNCLFNNNKGYGIWDYDNGFNYSHNIFTAFESNRFTNNTLSALRITIDGMGAMDAKSTYLNNGQKFLEVDGSRGFHTNTVVQKIDVPYMITGSVVLQQKMTVSPGVTFLFNTDAGFTLASGTLIANGTSSNRIKFNGYKSGVGVWLGLSLGNNDPEISLQYCDIDGAGSNKPNSTACFTNVKAAVNFYPQCYYYSTKAMVANCTITNSGGYGIVYKKGVNITLRSNTYAGNVLANEAVVEQ